jgi:hypothetical protein
MRVLERTDVPFHKENPLQTKINANKQTNQVLSNAIIKSVFFLRNKTPLKSLYYTFWKSFFIFHFISTNSNICCLLLYSFQDLFAQLCHTLFNPSNLNRFQKDFSIWKVPLLRTLQKHYQLIPYLKTNFESS